VNNGTRILFLSFVIAAAGCDRQETDRETKAAVTEPATIADRVGYVGRSACNECHRDTSGRWSGSHHDLAMQPADGATVVGDFDNARFAYAGISSSFKSRNGDFYVETDGPEGQIQEYTVAYTFGIDPLQQYLIEFPDGRLQALSIAWDTRPAEEGGQRWFHLYPDERIDATDELHWTRRSQNWNYMCADCHSTGYRKNYDAKTDRFASTWTDIDVACEACHGPGSRHVALAEAGRLAEDTGLIVSFADPDRRWVREPGQSTARLVGAATPGVQVEACGRCHARRASIRTGYAHGRPLTDSYVPAFLTEPLYYPDGQIRDEVYVYGSFLQSRMHAAGVVCTDCHDPHSVQLKADGDMLCAQCHAPEVFAVAKHHHHGEAELPPACVDCHMPSRNYMVIDGRRDHSFRVPRPDLAEALGVTDACDACHADRPDGWSAAAVREWLGRDASGYQQFGEVFRAAETGQVDAADRLIALLKPSGQPPIVRATALAHLAAYPSPAGVQLIAVVLDDPDPLVRLGALEAMAPLPLSMKQDQLLGLLDDPILSVRTEAARQLAAVPPASLSPEQRDTLKSALAEYVAIQKGNADRPESRLNLALLYAAAGETETAERQLEAAIRLHPDFDPAYVNLADLYRARGEEARAEAVLQQGLAVRPESPAINHSLGLLAVRRESGQAALPWLEKAATLAPGNARYGYVWAVALHDTGRLGEAISVLDRAHAQWPADADVLYALAIYSREAGDNPAAVAYAEKLQELQPNNPQAAAFVDELKSQ
jgi:predicted CXXCH cytochrome family protein